MLRLDANKAWSITTARFALRGLETHDVFSIEDPVRTPDELARLRQTTSIGFSTHEPDLASALRLGVPDAFVINLAALGGIRRWVSFIRACEDAGIDVWFYSPDAGIANAAYLQVAAALDWLSQPSQTLLRWHRDDVIIDGPFKPKNGELPVPDGPGLSVTLDREALARCHTRFLDQGPYDVYAHPARPRHFGGPARRAL
jgi:glucarate dehydratase